MEISKKPTVIICLSHYSGGMELNSLKLAKNISNYIDDVTLVVRENTFLHNVAKEDKTLHQNNINFETINFKRTLSFSIIKEARRIVMEKSIENIIFLGASELKSLYFAFYGLDINLIVRHGTTKSTPKKDFFHRLIYSNVNYHVAVSKHILKNVRYIVPFGDKTKDKVIYNSVKIPEIKQNVNLSDKTRFKLVHVGRITPGKGQVDAIKACKVLYEKGIDFSLDLVGDLNETFKDEFHRFYNTIEYKDKINLIGHTTKVKEYLKKADVFIFPSHGEGFSNAFIEALSYQLVAVTYNNTSFPEFKELDFYFHLIENKNINKLQEILYEIYINLDAEKKSSLINLQKVIDNFSIDIEMKNYLEILR